MNALILNIGQDILKEKMPQKIYIVPIVHMGF